MNLEIWPGPVSLYSPRSISTSDVIVDPRELARSLCDTASRLICSLSGIDFT